MLPLRLITDLQGKITGESTACRERRHISQSADSFFTLPALQGDSRIIVDGREENSFHIEMTIDMLSEFGVRIEREARGGGGAGYIIVERAGLGKSGMLGKITTTLSALGADIIENADGLIIQGKQKLRGGTVSSLSESCIVMMTAIAACVCDDTVAINDAQAVSQTYPDFFDDYEKLGGKLHKK